MNKTLALLTRALRTESRDIKSHLFRLALAMLIVLILYLGRMYMEVASAPGRTMFWWMTVANWVVITLGGGTFFAIAISEETEQQTLGLLRMANVGPLSLLLGKWLPRMLTAIVLISIQFPFTWLTVTLGGVSWQQIWASYLMLLAHLILVGNVGLFCSVLKPTSAQACGLAFGLMIAYRVLPIFGLGVLLYLNQHGLVQQATCTWYGEHVVSPTNQITASGRLFGEILSTSFKGNAWTPQVIWNLAIGAGLFLLSWFIFDPVTMRHMSGGPQKKSLLARLFTRKTRTSGACWDWALGWKDFRQVGGGFRWILIKIALYGVLFGGILYTNNALYGSDFFEATKTAASITAWMTFWLALPLELCFLAAKLFRPELNDQTWSTLLSLPKSLPEIAYSKIAGAMLSLIPTVVVLCVCSSPFIGDLLDEIVKSTGLMLAIIYAISGVLLGLHLITFFSISIDWAAWPIAIVLGVGVTFFGNLVAWIFFGLTVLGMGGGGGEGVIYAWTTMLICGTLVLTGITHYGIAARLTIKGASS